MFKFYLLTVVALLVAFHFTLLAEPPLEGGVLPHYQQFAAGPIYLPEVIPELSDKERKQLVTYIIDKAKREYMNVNKVFDYNQDVQWGQIRTYLPIQIIQTRDPGQVAGMRMCTPRDLEELAGSAIISYGKFPQENTSVIFASP